MTSPVGGTLNRGPYMSGHVLLHKNAVSYLQSCFNQRKPLILSNNSRAVDVQFFFSFYFILRIMGPLQNRGHQQ